MTSKQQRMRGAAAFAAAACLVAHWAVAVFPMQAAADSQLQQQQPDELAALHALNTTLLAELLRTAQPRPFVGAFASKGGWHAAPSARSSGGSSGQQEGAADAGHEWAMDGAAYALYNPQFRLQAAGPDALTDAAARAHYDHVGKGSGAAAFCSRIPVAVRYPAFNGLCSMAVCHIAAWAIAVALGADVVLPRVNKRESFQRSMRYQRVPYDTLYHLPTTLRLLSELGSRAVMEHQLPAEAEFSNRTLVLKLTSRIASRSPECPRAYYDLGELILQLTKEVVKAAWAAQGSAPAASCVDPPVVLLDLQHTCNVLRTSQLPLAAHLARRLRYSEVVEARAELVEGTLRALGHTQWNGLHLRLEADGTSKTIGRFGGMEATLKMYLDLCKQMGGWDAATPVYVASGLFTYADGIRTFNHSTAFLSPIGSQFIQKELLEQQMAQLQLKQGQARRPHSYADANNSSSNSTRSSSSSGVQLLLPQLDSEQAGAVDLLLLLRAQRYVGMSTSAMSWHVVQQRLLAGHSPRHSALLNYSPQPGEQMWLYREVKSYLPGCAVMQCAGG